MPEIEARTDLTGAEEIPRKKKTSGEDNQRQRHPAAHQRPAEPHLAIAAKARRDRLFGGLPGRQQAACDGRGYRKDRPVDRDAPIQIEPQVKTGWTKFRGAPLLLFLHRHL